MFSSLNKFKKNILYWSGMTAAHYPFLFKLKALRNDIKVRSVTTDTNLCIEGFQRSGNSFLVSVIGSWNKDIKIASHLHSAAQVKKAIALNIPTILLIRHPLDSIASLITMNEDLSIGLALKCYTRFYKSIIPIRDQVVIAPFQTTTTVPHQLIQETNERYRSNFDHKELGEASIKLIIDDANTNHSWDQAPVPNVEKNKRKDTFKKKIKSNRHYLEAINVYNNLLSTRISPA